MFGNKERLSYLWDMNETNTPLSFTDLLNAAAPSQSQSLKSGPNTLKVSQVSKSSTALSLFG